MGTVHVWVSTGRFGAVPEMRPFIDATYTEDGDELPSDFMREVDLDDYEPMTIEAIISPTGAPVPLPVLVAKASYAEQWAPNLDSSRLADAAICVFLPNVPRKPGGSSPEYVGEFAYEVIHPEWFLRILRGEPPLEPGSAPENADAGA